MFRVDADLVGDVGGQIIGRGTNIKHKTWWRSTEWVKGDVGGQIIGGGTHIKHKTWWRSTEWVSVVRMGLTHQSVPLSCLLLL